MATAFISGPFALGAVEATLTVVDPKPLPILKRLRERPMQAEWVSLDPVLRHDSASSLTHAEATWSQTLPDWDAPSSPAPAAPRSAASGLDRASPPVPSEGRSRQP